MGDTTTIGRYSPQGDSPYGCADMAGNLWEWCQSIYKPYPYHAGDDREALEARGMRVLRGGACWSSAPDVRCGSRDWDDPDYRYNLNGFRVVTGRLR